jgi:hypothetical protein
LNTLSIGELKSEVKSFDPVESFMSNGLITLDNANRQKIASQAPEFYCPTRLQF